MFDHVSALYKCRQGTAVAMVAAFSKTSLGVAGGCEALPGALKDLMWHRPTPPKKILYFE